MRFIEIILDNSTVKESKLYAPSKKASINPDTGVTILNKSAYHVIKDCATIANRYLPIFVFGQYPDPVKALYGKFLKNEIEEFISSANSNFVHDQLLTIILSKIGKTIEPEKEETPIKISYTVNENDPYGEYGNFGFQEQEIKVKTPKDNNTLGIICEAFGAK
jgi:hypothetical protein